MAKIVINDLADSLELDRTAMQSVVGGTARSAIIHQPQRLLWSKTAQNSEPSGPFVDLIEGKSRS